MVKVGIDPGHGGVDRKNVGPTGYVEADGVLDMALACREELIENGYDVVMTRQEDVTLLVGERAKILNQAGVDLAVSIHSNAAGDPKVNGIETIYSIQRNGLGSVFAKKIALQLNTDLQRPIRRVFSRESEVSPGKDYYGMIRRTNMPCVIVEVEFHTNPEAEQLLKSAEFREKAGKSIAKGIMKFMEE